MALGDVQKLVTVLEADLRNLKAGLREGSAEVGRYERKVSFLSRDISKSFASIKAPVIATAGTVTALAVLTRGAIRSADGIAKTAKAAGLAGEAYQELSHAARLAGATQQQFDMSIIRLTTNIGKASDGQKEMVDVFNELGLELGPTEDVLNQIAERFRGIDDDATKSRLAAKLFGEEAGPRLVSMLEKGKEGLDEARKSIGAMFSEEQLRRAEDLNDRIEILSGTFGVQFKSALVEVAEWLQTILERLGMIEAQSLSGISARADKLAGEIRELDKALADKEAALAAGRGDPAMIAQRILENRQLRAAKAQELGGLRQREDTALEREVARRGTNTGPRVTPDGAPVGGETGPRGPLRSKADIEAERREAEKKAEDERKRAEKLAAEREAIDRILEIETRVAEVRLSAGAEQAERVRELFDREEELAEMRKRGATEAQIKERQRIHILEDLAAAEERAADAEEKRAQTIRDTVDGIAQTVSAMATESEDALDQLKDRLIQTILQVAGEEFGNRLGGGGEARSGGQIFQAVLGGVFGGGFAGGGSPPGRRISLVGERGPELRMERGGAQIVPMSRAGSMFGSPDVNVNVEPRVEIMLEPGLTATQQRRRGLDGQTALRVAVKQAVQDELQRSGSLSNAVAGQTGQRLAARRGIS